MRRGASGLNLLLGIDKPAGITSHDVVARVRRSIGERRVGHAGTLDPAATGVMLVGVGQGTRLMGSLTSERKAYVADICFGCETTTDDAEGEVTLRKEPDGRLWDPAVAAAALSSLVGSSMQVPPSYSAISVDGRRAYARARSGEDVVLEARPIEVFDAVLLTVEDAKDLEGADALVWRVAFTVSKGTYIRALARDLGRSIGAAAHLLRLCRTASGTLTLAQCATLDTVAELGAERIREIMVDPVALLGHVRFEVRPRQLAAVTSGRRMSVAGNYAEGEHVSMVSDGRLLGIWHYERGTLVPDVNFPAGVEGVR